MTNNKYSFHFSTFITFSIIIRFTTTSLKSPYSEIILPSFNPQAGFLLLFGRHHIMINCYLEIWINSFDLKILKLYFVHLFFNGTWSIVFFGFHQIGLALINLAVILIFIILLMKNYFNIDKISFYLMIPYLVWSSYALILNSSIFILN